MPPAFHRNGSQQKALLRVAALMAAGRQQGSSKIRTGRCVYLTRSALQRGHAIGQGVCVQVQVTLHSRQA